MSMSQKRAAAALVVSIISLLQGCRSSTPSRQAEGPGVHRSLILCTPEQAAEQARRAGPVRVEGIPVLTAAPRSETGDSDKGSRPLTPPRITQYHIGRYIDPQDPRLMHEAHVVYRIEEDASWNTLPLETEVKQEPQTRK